MILDILLSLLRLWSCYCLAMRIRASWLLIMLLQIFKIATLQSLGLSILAASKCLLFGISCLAWLQWRPKTQVNRPLFPIALSPAWQARTAYLFCLLMIYLYVYTRIDTQIVIMLCNLTAYCLAALQCSQCWLIWMLYDLFLMQMFVDMAMPLSACTTLLYIPIAIYGHYFWQQTSTVHTYPSTIAA